MSLWEFAACLDGFREFHGSKPAAPEFEDDDLRALGIEGFV